MSKSRSLQPRAALRKILAEHPSAVAHENRPAAQRRVYEHVVHQVRQGQWSLGEKIVEANLAEQFNTSIINVRAATEPLIAEGWVERIPNRGLFVKDYSLDQIKHIYGVREMIDAEAIRVAAPMLNDEHLAELTLLNEVIEQAVGKVDFHCAREADAHFHRMLVHYSGNPKLAEMFEPVLLMTLGSLLPMEDELPYDEAAARKLLSVAGHKRICSALGERDASKAVKAARQHVQAACQTSAKLYEYRRQRKSVATGPS